MLDLDSMEAFSQKGRYSSTPHVTYDRLALSTWGNTGIAIEDVLDTTKEDYANSTHRNAIALKVVRNVLRKISEHPNPETLAAVGSVADLPAGCLQNIHFQHTSGAKEGNVSNCQTMPSLVEEIERGDNLPLAEGDHNLVTKCENGTLSLYKADVEDWMMETARPCAQKVKYL